MSEELEPYPLEVVTKGRVSKRAKAYAEAKLRHLVEQAGSPVLFARVKLTQRSNPSTARPAMTEVMLDLNGRPLRVHVAGAVMTESVDLAIDLLRQRLHDERRRVTDHQHRPELVRRATPRRRLVRRKTYLDEPMSIDEAIFDLGQLDVDFYLFTDEVTGRDAVLERTGDGMLSLTDIGGPAEGNPSIRVLPAHVAATGRTPPELGLDEALEWLRSSGAPRLFFLDDQTGRGAVVYHRYDGDDGLMSPAHA